MLRIDEIKRQKAEDKEMFIIDYSIPADNFKEEKRNEYEEYEPIK